MYNHHILYHTCSWGSRRIYPNLYITNSCWIRNSHIIMKFLDISFSHPKLGDTCQVASCIQPSDPWSQNSPPQIHPHWHHELLELVSWRILECIRKYKLWSNMYIIISGISNKCIISVDLATLGLHGFMKSRFVFCWETHRLLNHQTTSQSCENVDDLPTHHIIFVVGRAKPRMATMEVE